MHRRLPALANYFDHGLDVASCVPDACIPADGHTCKRDLRKLARSDPLHRVNLLNPMRLGALHSYSPHVARSRGGEKASSEGLELMHVICLGARE